MVGHLYFSNFNQQTSTSLPKNSPRKFGMVPEYRNSSVEQDSVRDRGGPTTEANGIAIDRRAPKRRPGMPESLYPFYSVFSLPAPKLMHGFLQARTYFLLLD